MKQIMNNNSTILWILISAVLACLVVAAEVRPDQRDAAPPVSITIRGSDAFLDLTNRWLTAFRMQAANFAYVLDPSGSSEGIEDLVAGRTDIAMTSRQIKPQELESARQTGVTLHETLVAQTGIGVIVHPSNSVSLVTFEQLGDVFAGAIRNWQELGGPDEPIVVIQKVSGSSPRLFREEVLGERAFATESVVVDSKDAVVVEVAKRPWSIGFTGLQNVIEGLGTVQLLLLQRNDPDEGSTYALKRPFFFYTIEGNPNVQPFIEFVAGEKGQALVKDPGFFPAS